MSKTKAFLLIMSALGTFPSPSNTWANDIETDSSTPHFTGSHKETYLKGPNREHYMNVDQLVKLSLKELSNIGSNEIKNYTPAEIDTIEKYAFGYHFHKDYKRAAALHRIAALGGNVEAQGEYAQMLFQGLGVKRDPFQSLEWSLAAARNGDREMLAFLYNLSHSGGLASKFDLKDKRIVEDIIKETEEIRRKIAGSN